MSAKDNKRICSLLEKPANATAEAAEKAENAKDSASIKKLGKGLFKVSKPAGKLTSKRAELNKIKQNINRPIKGLMLSHSTDLNGFYLSYLLYVFLNKK